MSDHLGDGKIARGFKLIEQLNISIFLGRLNDFKIGH
jgi:hypothetical protein